MTTTTKTADFVGRALITPDSDARDFINRGIMAGDRDFMGRLLTDAEGGGSDASALLDEAAVRFDFSQYDDINNMVDVNGGWGPLTDVTAETTLELVPGGMRGAPGLTWKVDDIDGPLVLGPDGMTLVNVFDVQAHGSGAKGAQIDVYGDWGGDYAPEVYTTWQVSNSGGNDQLIADMYDLAPGYATVFGGAPVSIPPVGPVDSFGYYMVVQVVDVAAQETRIRLVGPAGVYDATKPFLVPVPAFVSDPKVVDYLSSIATFGDMTQREWLGWNRVLTDPEADALVAHFTA